MFFCLLDGFIELYSSVTGLVGRHQCYLFFHINSQSCYYPIKECIYTVLPNIKKGHSTRRIGRMAMHLPNGKWSTQSLPLSRILKPFFPHAWRQIWTTFIFFRRIIYLLSFSALHHINPRIRSAFNTNNN